MPTPTYIARIDAHIPGARNESSTSTDYLRALPAATIERFDVGTTETLVTANPCILLGAIGNTGNTGATELRNAAATGGGSTPLITVDLGAGSSVDMFGAIFTSGLTIDGANAAHDVTLIWLPL